MSLAADITGEAGTMYELQLRGVPICEDLPSPVILSRAMRPSGGSVNQSATLLAGPNRRVLASLSWVERLDGTLHIGIARTKEFAQGMGAQHMLYGEMAGGARAANIKKISTSWAWDNREAFYAHYVETGDKLAAAKQTASYRTLSKYGWNLASVEANVLPSAEYTRSPLFRTNLPASGLPLGMDRLGWGRVTTGGVVSPAALGGVVPEAHRCPLPVGTPAIASEFSPELRDAFAQRLARPGSQPAATQPRSIPSRVSPLVVNGWQGAQPGAEMLISTVGPDLMRAVMSEKNRLAYDALCEKNERRLKAEAKASGLPRASDYEIGCSKSPLGTLWYYLREGRLPRPN